MARRQDWQVHIFVFSVLLLSELVESKCTDIFCTSTTIHCANKFAKCSTKVIINWVIFTKSWHSFLWTRYAVHYFPTWRVAFTSDEGVKTDGCISVVFLHLNIWHLRYLSSCTSATIEDQTGGLKRCQCHDKDVCVSRMWPDDDWTIGIDSMFRKYHQSKICLFMCWHQAVYGTEIWYW